MLIKTKTLEEATLMKAALFDSMDTVISPNGGHLVVVAVSCGVPVCWQCGEPFDENDRRFRMLEKKNDLDSTVPCGVHAKCFDPSKVFSVGAQIGRVAAGIREKTKLARVLNAADKLADIVRGVAGKIVT